MRLFLKHWENMIKKLFASENKSFLNKIFVGLTQSYFQLFSFGDKKHDHKSKILKDYYSYVHMVCFLDIHTWNFHVSFSSASEIISQNLTRRGLGCWGKDGRRLHLCPSRWSSACRLHCTLCWRQRHTTICFLETLPSRKWQSKPPKLMQTSGAVTSYY